MKNNLIDKLKTLAKATGIEESSLILDEARYFTRTHKQIEYFNPSS